MRYSAIVRVEITDEEMAPDQIISSEVNVEFDSPEDPREMLTKIALAEAFQNVQSAERFMP